LRQKVTILRRCQFYGFIVNSR
jgi:predicted AAA+ superfamily ATPase